MTRRAALSLIFLTLFVRTATAVCILLPAKDVLRDPGTVMFFKGRVIAERDTSLGWIVTFDVERVWKGDVRRSEVLLNENLGDETRAFRVGDSYFVTAYHRSDADHDHGDLPPNDLPPNATNGCSFWRGAPEGLSRLRGHPPTKSR